VATYQERISELADLMQEFRLAEASLEMGGMSVAFRRKPARSVVVTESVADAAPSEAYSAEAYAAPEPEAPKGTPIASPMTGIFYNSPSPSSPAFVKEGESITAGQIVGLIEAMKVFNEIPATISGNVLKIVVQAGQLVNVGDILMYVG